jgi:hypothetical protein
MRACQPVSFWHIREGPFLEFRQRIIVHLLGKLDARQRRMSLVGY